jgi:dTDP-4-dehydrorhamnose reductase
LAPNTSNAAPRLRQKIAHDAVRARSARANLGFRGVKIAVIGANGQLGSDIVRAARHRGVQAVALTHADCDARDPVSLDRALAGIGAGDVVVNTAAMHNVDACELDPETAVAVNSRGAYYVARAAETRGAAGVFVSTDFVFDGVKRAPYVESDQPAPLSVYGATKYTGEALASSMPQHYIMRVSSLFGVAGASGKGGNFVETMLALAHAGEAPKVVDDLTMSPTSTADAAGLLLELLRRRAPAGIYHCSNDGALTWREFADEIFAQCGLAVRAQPIRAKEAGRRARRPPYSALRSERLASLDLRARPWRDGLTDYLRAKGYRS